MWKHKKSCLSQTEVYKHNVVLSKELKNTLIFSFHLNVMYVSKSIQLLAQWAPTKLRHTSKFRVYSKTYFLTRDRNFRKTRFHMINVPVLDLHRNIKMESNVLYVIERQLLWLPFFS